MSLAHNERSGTTICARMISRDLSCEYIDEGRFRVHDVQSALRQAKAYKPCVVQGPGLLKDAMVFGQLDYCAVVLMVRDTLDIAASVENRYRLKWLAELKRYIDTSLMNEPLLHFGDVIYNHWDDEVVQHIKNPYEIDYESLCDHPLWVPKKQRKNWRVRQWRI